VMALERFLAKHVEMNYHARLVLFLRSQGVVTQLEAEEYLNPALGGPGSSSLAQPNVHARHAVRRAAVVHGSILGVLAMMLALIHIAPLGRAQTITGPGAPPPPSHGFVRVQAYPWAHVWVDGKDAGTTPLVTPIELVEGVHTVKVEHDWYQPIERQVEIKPGRPDAAAEVTVDFEAQGQLKIGRVRPSSEELVP